MDILKLFEQNIDNNSFFCYNCNVVYAPVAQPDRAIASDAMCRRFDSGRVYQKGAGDISLALFLFKSYTKKYCMKPYSCSKFTFFLYLLEYIKLL